MIRILLVFILFGHTPAMAQTAPSPQETAAYSGLHRAAHDGNITNINRLIAAGADINARDAAGRTPAHVAAFASQDKALDALAKAGANLNLLENDAYDVVTIAAVANDPDLMSLALKLGNRPDLVTSRWDGTALIAAAELGHYKIVQQLITSGAPLDHVNNLGWTALMEAIILGDGGSNHTKIVQSLVKAGADISIPDKDGITPLQHATSKGYGKIMSILESAQK